MKYRTVFLATILLGVASCHAHAQLANNTYLFQSGANSVDGGFGYYDGAVGAVQMYPSNTGNGQKWTWNGSTLQNVMASSSGSNVCSGPCFLREAADATATESTSGDTLTLAASGSSCSIKNNRTGHFLHATGTGPSGLKFDATATAFAVKVSSSGAAASCGTPPPPPPPVNGACGSANGTATSSAPTANFCSSGTATAVAGSGPWTWSCNGTNGGTNASCSAPLQGTSSCGPANGVAVSSAPTTGLCPSAQTASSVSGSGPWSWTCTLSGASPASCTAPLAASWPSAGGAPGTLAWKNINPDDAVFLHVPHAMTVTQIAYNIDTALGGVGTVKVRKVPPAAIHCDDASGVDLTTGTIDANIAVGSTIAPFASSAAQLSPGDRVCLVAVGAGWNNIAANAQGAVTVTAQ